MALDSPLGDPAAAPMPSERDRAAAYASEVIRLWAAGEQFFPEPSQKYVWIAVEFDALLADFGRLEREAAEREVARLADEERYKEGTALVFARVREVEAERDKLVPSEKVLTAIEHMREFARERAEYSPGDQIVKEWVARARAVLASPEAPAAEPPLTQEANEVPS